MATFPIDRFDYKVLYHLQREGRCSNVDLADAVGLSPSPCLLRTKRLQENGIIRGYRADIALEQLGEVVTVLSEVKISAHRPQDFRRFEQGIAFHEEIVECFNVSGGYDYLLKIVVPSVAHFQKLTERMLDDDIGVEKLSNRIVLRTPFQVRPEPLNLVLTRHGSTSRRT